MYLHLQPVLNRNASVADLFVAPLASSQDVSQLLPDVEPVMQRLQQVRQADPILLDLWGVDRYLTVEEIGKIVRAIRNHWHQHGFCIARCNDPYRWVQATYDYRQPLLHWRSLSIFNGWDLIGGQLRATELDVFRLLVDRGTTTVEHVARDARVFSPQIDFNDPQVQRDILMRRMPRGPIEFNRSEARNILTRMRNRRIVIERGGFYGIVRPTRDNGV
jgi:hypothetical protein